MTELIPELDPAVEVDPAAELDPEPELLVDVDGVLAPALEAAAELCALCRASAGSWPLTSIRVISSQVATNSATAPVITRLRIIRTRASRASRIDIACACVIAKIFRRARIRGVRGR